MDPQAKLYFNKNRFYVNMFTEHSENHIHLSSQIFMERLLCAERCLRPQLGEDTDDHSLDLEASSW